MNIFELRTKTFLCIISITNTLAIIGCITYCVALFLCKVIAQFVNMICARIIAIINFKTRLSQILRFHGGGFCAVITRDRSNIFTHFKCHSVAKVMLNCMISITQIQ